MLTTGLTGLLLACSAAKPDASEPAPTDSGDGGAVDTAVPEDTGEPDPDPNAWHADCPRDQAEQRMIDVGEVTLNVACRGSGPTVVFLHGFPEWHYSWNAVMDELVDDYRLIAPDQRGYNTSDKPEDVADYALPILAADITALLPLVSPEPVILVAHDWGGPVGWMVAHGSSASDERPFVGGFVAANGPHPVRFAELIENDPDQQAASAYMEFFRSEAADTALTPAALAGWFDFLSEEDLALYMEAWGQPGAIRGGLNWYRANALDGAAATDWMALMNPTVDVPVTVLWGLDDDAVLPQNAEGLEPYAPDLVVETFEGVDHWIEHRIPGEVARAIREVHGRM
jgi:pimeloyl-ACP methyl ester carboxylesterase